MNESISNKGVCRTALDKTGLLTTGWAFGGPLVLHRIEENVLRQKYLFYDNILSGADRPEVVKIDPPTQTS